MFRIQRRHALFVGTILVLLVGAWLLAFLRRPLGDATAGPEPSPLVQLPAADPSRVSLLGFGDWGQNTDAERAVAAGIRSYGQHFDAGLLLGDNFYFPLSGVDDPRWRTLFEDLYQPAALRFFAVLGNHDYHTSAAGGYSPGASHRGRRTNKDVELDYARRHPGGRWNLPARWYRIDLPAGDPLVSILMLDSNHAASAMTAADWRRQTRWLRRQLDELRPPDPTRPRRRWVICCAHHPIFTNGSVHDDDPRLRDDWLPLFESHGVDFYLAGHNHVMEHVQPPGSTVTHLTSGGGGAGLYGEDRRHPGWFASSHGFTHLTLTAQAAEVRFLDAEGQLLYGFERRPGGTDSGPPPPTDDSGEQP